MDMNDKKFYLDQAKKLKDNFNNKYPDYVYRRRPNNSRRKRKPEAEAQSPIDPSSTGDTDETSYDDASSPIEPEDSTRDSGGPYLYRPASQLYENGEFLPSQTAPSYPYQVEYPSSSQYTQPPRIPTLPSQDTSLSSNTLTPLRIPSLAETVANAQGAPYNSSHSNHSASQTTITSPTQSNQASSQPYWETRQGSRNESSRTSSSWTALPALDMSIPRQRSSTNSTIASTMSSRSEQFSPHVPQRPWSSSASSATSSSSGGAGGASGGNFNNSPFPTLTSPFYPQQSPTQRAAEAASSPTSTSGGSPEYFAGSAYRTVPSTARPGAEQAHHPYASSPTMSHTNAQGYGSQWSSAYGRSSGEPPRSLPSRPPVSGYSMAAGSSSPPSSGAGTQAYWERNRFDAR